MNKLYHWITDSLFPWALPLLFLFIPLYPKLPLLDIKHTWVYIRLEDIVVAFVTFLLVLSFLKDRKVFKNRLFRPMVLYWVIGLVSLLHAIFILAPSIPQFFPHLGVLHFLRRIEYMSLFFVAYSAISKKRSMVSWFVFVIAICVAIVVLYGLGQKFLGFPAFLTMNEEFAKGIPLRLPPTARIPSTFGGHYDLAAFLVLMIPILGSLSLGAKKLWSKLAFFCIGLSAYVLLLLTASRTSFAVYLIAMIALLIFHKKRWLIIPVVLGSFFLMNFVSGASERFYKTLRFDDVIVDLSSGKPIGTLDKLEGGTAVVDKIESPAEESLPKGSEFIGVAGGPKIDQSSIKTVEVFTSKDLASGSGEIATISGSFLIQKALVYDISITTRFQGQWPRAAEAFRRNILLGSGFSSLSVAVDGGFHRLFGEIGILGAIAFLGIFAYAFSAFFHAQKSLTGMEKAYVIGVFAGIIGLFFNAILIDVFEASKVAFVLWMLLGSAMAIIDRAYTTRSSYVRFLSRILLHPVSLVGYLLIVLSSIHSGGLSGYFLGDDFTWLRWAAESNASSVPLFFKEAQGFFYRPIPKLWYFLLYAIFWLKPSSYHFLSYVLFGGSTLFLFGILRYLRLSLWLSLILSGLFGVLAIHHENIYWVSGQSSLLAAFFVFASILMFFKVQTVSSRIVQWGMCVAMVGLTFLGMLSYDGTITTPVLLSILGLYYRPKAWKLALLPLLLIPVYWWMRTSAGAVLPFGEYGYNAAVIIPNILGNTVTYAGAIVFGPKVIEYVEILRGTFRESYVFIEGSGFLVLLGLLFITKRFGKKIVVRELLVWSLVFCVSLVSYLGLGNVAERYALLASGFVIIILGIFVREIFSRKLFWMSSIVVVVLFGLIGWNMQELHRLQGDWKKASDISEQSLLTIRKQFFPLNLPKTFFFLNVPIRYGRAWVFPTGLDDALWHMFRMNQYPYVVVKVKDVDEAFTYPILPNSNREVMEFNEGKIRRIFREVQTIDTKSGTVITTQQQ